MTAMSTRQWMALMLGLWALLVVAWFVLDGVPRAIAETCVAAGFVASSVERWRNMRRQRSTRH